MTLGSVNYMKRIERVRSGMEKQGISALILTRLQSLTYLSGVFVPYRSVLYLPLKGEPRLFPSQLEVSRIANETWIPVESWAPFLGNEWPNKVALLVREAGLEKANLGIESGISPRVATGYLTAGEMELLKSVLPEANLIEASNIMEEACRIKDPIEISYLRQAAAIADAGHLAVISELEVGMTETAIAGIGERAMREAGSEWNWPYSGGSEIASGYRSGYLACGCTPATRKIVQTGEILFVDLHCTFNLYYSDYSTNYIMGTPSKEQAELASIFTEAAHILIDKMQPGTAFSEISDAVMKFLAEHNYAQYVVPIFGHGLGTCGDEFYPPVLNYPPWNNMILEPNMVEEAYLQLNIPDVGGFRLEAPLLITARGNEMLCKVNWEPRVITE
ncbi:MAG: M24 family metallopeptidase [Chitinophagales bacterium]